MRNIRLNLLVLCGSIALSLLTVCFAGSEETPAASPAASPPLSTHVLNTTTGKAASGVNLILQKQTGGGWDELRKVKTDSDPLVELLTHSVNRPTPVKLPPLT